MRGAHVQYDTCIEPGQLPFFVKIVFRVFVSLDVRVYYFLHMSTSERHASQL